MKFIQKGEEPDFFREWKEGGSQDWSPDWAAFDGTGEVKRQLMEHLIKEQGTICCYCNRELRKNDFHIEHFKPKDEDKYPELALDYNNLLISCQRQIQRREPRHCGMKKDNWFEEDVIVSPLENGCETRFEYLVDGRVRATNNDPGACETINRLGLDIDKLRELRKAALEAALEAINGLGTNELRNLINVYRQRSPVTNRFQPFCVAIIQVLESLL